MKKEANIGYESLEVLVKRVSSLEEAQHLSSRIGLVTALVLASYLAECQCTDSSRALERSWNDNAHVRYIKCDI